MAEVWDKQNQRFTIREDMGINIMVKVSCRLHDEPARGLRSATSCDRDGCWACAALASTMLTPIPQEVKEDHIVTSTRGPAEGKFAFTSHEAGDHQICLSSASSSADAPQVRMHLDVVIGEARPDNSAKDRAHIVDLAGRVRLLNDRLRDIRKEQQYQREREAAFRDLSEQTNSRAVWWSIIQGVVLVLTGAWQLRSLTVSPPRTGPGRRSYRSSAGDWAAHRRPRRRRSASPLRRCRPLASALSVGPQRQPSLSALGAAS